MIHFSVSWKPINITEEELVGWLERDLDDHGMMTGEGDCFGLPVVLQEDRADDLSWPLVRSDIEVAGNFFDRRVRDGSIQAYQITGIRGE